MERILRTRTHAPGKRAFGLFLIIVILYLFTTACAPDYVTRGDFYYLNNSGFDLIVERYRAEPDTMIRVERIEIKKKREYKKRIDFEGPDNIACEDFRPPMESDSLAFRFSNGTVVSYNLQDTTRKNPMLLRNYVSQKVAQNFCEFRFTIK